MANLGKLLVLSGAILMGLGVLFWLSPRFPWLSRLGRLPGDIRIERENFSFYFPLASCLLLSVLLTLLLFLFKGFRR